MSFRTITYAVQDRRARIMLNRPEKRNALNDDLVEELTSAFGLCNKDPQVKVVRLEASGSAFCAGADLEYLNKISAYSLEDHRADSLRLSHLFRAIYELRKPVIAVVNGPAIAGGCGLATACDFVIASRESARFGYSEVHIGFIPAIVLTFLVKRVGEGKARELVLRGNVISADEAQSVGLVNSVVPAAELHAAADALVDELLTKNSLTAMALCKEMFSKMHGLNFVDNMDFAANMNAAARMTDDWKAGVAGFLKKEPLEW